MPQSNGLALFENGLCYYGVVTAATAPNFTIAALAGYGETKFVGWEAYVMRSHLGTGAAPQQEHQTISSYASTNGLFVAPAFTVALAPGDEVLVLHPMIANTPMIASKARVLITPLPFWSDPQLGVTVPAVAATLALPSVTIAGLPSGAIVTHAKVIMTSRVIENLNAALNKLNGATVALTSQVIQVQKGAGAWVDAISFIDDQLSIAGSTREGGPVLICATDLASTITGNDTYNFRWLLALADLASLYLQGTHMIIQLDYSI